MAVPLPETIWDLDTDSADLDLIFAEEEQHPGCAALMAFLFSVYFQLICPLVVLSEHKRTGVTGNSKRLDIMQR